MSRAISTPVIDRVEPPYDVEAVRADFPILTRRVHGPAHPLVAAGIVGLLLKGF